jgi:hypothetical protein
MGSSQREVFCANLTSHLVGLDLVIDLLAFGETTKASTFNSTDVNKHIAAAVVWLDESEALLAVEPFHSTCRHFLLQSAQARSARQSRGRFNFVDVFGKGARGRDQQGTAANRMQQIYTLFVFLQGRLPFLFSDRRSRHRPGTVPYLPGRVKALSIESVARWW